MASRRRDPWLPGPVLLVHADEAHALWPLIQRGLAEWTKMGATSRLDQVDDLLARWRHLAAAYDDQLAGSGGGTAGGAPDGGRRGSTHASSTEAADAPGQWVTTAVAAAALRCSSRWVTELARRGELDARKAGAVWLVDAGSVAAYRERSA